MAHLSAGVVGSVLPRTRKKFECQRAAADKTCKLEGEDTEEERTSGREWEGKNKKNKNSDLATRKTRLCCHSWYGAGQGHSWGIMHSGNIFKLKIMDFTLLHCQNQVVAICRLKFS